MDTTIIESCLKVVARLRDGNMVKGHTGSLPALDFDSLFKRAPIELPHEIDVQSAESGKLVSLPLESLKALFFVKSFEGRKEYREIKFFNTHPPIQGLWVRVKFSDGENLEGVVHNSIHYLAEPGFFLKPPDPNSNNEIVYVVKASLIDFRVLGVRSTY